MCNNIPSLEKIKQQYHLYQIPEYQGQRWLFFASKEKKEQLGYCHHIALTHLSLSNNPTTLPSYFAFFPSQPAQHQAQQTPLRYRNDPYNATGIVYMQPRSTTM